MAEDTHELRTLRWKVKQLGKQNGKQGETIYNLRCQLAESRSFCTVDRSAYRSMRDQLAAALAQLKAATETVRELREENATRAGVIIQLSRDLDAAQRLLRNPQTLAEVIASERGMAEAAEVPLPDSTIAGLA